MGWWAQLVMLLFQIGLMLLLVPIAFLFKDNGPFYYSIAIVAYVFAIVPFGGWLFQRFSAKFAVDNGVQNVT
jgi:hypothetical protein